MMVSRTGTEHVYFNYIWCQVMMGCLVLTSVQIFVLWLCFSCLIQTNWYIAYLNSKYQLPRNWNFFLSYSSLAFLSANLSPLHVLLLLLQAFGASHFASGLGGMLDLTNCVTDADDKFVPPPFSLLFLALPDSVASHLNHKWNFFFLDLYELKFEQSVKWPQPFWSELLTFFSF